MSNTMKLKVHKVGVYMGRSLASILSYIAMGRSVSRDILIQQLIKEALAAYPHGPLPTFDEFGNPCGLLGRQMVDTERRNRSVITLRVPRPLVPSILSWGSKEGQSLALGSSSFGERVRMLVHHAIYGELHSPVSSVPNSPESPDSPDSPDSLVPTPRNETPGE